MTEKSLGEIVLGQIEGFAAEMKRRGIHVGMGNAPTRCVTCDEIWPCEGSKSQ